MREVQLGAHTLRSHGVKVARTHMHDWIILLLLVVIDVILNVINPFYRYVGEAMISDFKYPLKDNTVPFWAVPVFNNATGAVICHGEKSVIKEGHKSFPSGHTSWSFAGLGFLALYLAGKVKVFDQNGHVAKLCLVFLPLLAAALVGISRVDDYWHHWQDVFAGGLIGLAVATLCYLQFYPPPYRTEFNDEMILYGARLKLVGSGPYAYLRMLDERRPAAQQDNTANAFTVQPLEVESVYIQDEENKHTEPSRGRKPTILDEMEAGMR
ncbi:hypothetical protein ACLOJK_001246 [Asimina triloba]